jgi:branched-chain amino acid transport system substrate-binding protein
MMANQVWRWAGGVAAALALAIGVGGCGKRSAKAETIELGVILPLSGDLQAFGSSTLDGIKYRVEQLNQAGGIGGKLISLQIEDDRNDQSQCIAAVTKLSGLKGVTAIIGPITSTSALACSSTITAEKVPTLSPTATNDRVAPSSPYLFRACFNDSFQGRVIAHYAARDRGFKQAAVMTELSSDYSIGLVKSFTEAFTAAGGTIVAETSYQGKSTEFGTQLQKIRASGAELVFVPGYPGEVPLILKQAAVMGVDAVFCGADGWDHEDIIQKSGDKIVGAFFTGAFSPADTRPHVREFVTAIKQRTGREPGSFEALGYDSVTLLAEAMKARGTDREAVREGLLGLREVAAVTGPISITADGNAEKAAVVMGLDKQGEGYVKKYLATVAP